MDTVAAIGEETLVRGFGLVGALVLPAEDAAAVRAVWRRLPNNVSVVILTPAAAAVLDDRDRSQAWPLVAVMD